MVKCKDCGFLAVDICGDAKTADEHLRRSGERRGEDGKTYWAKLICSKASDSFDEIEYASPIRMTTTRGNERQKASDDNKSAMKNERECDVFSKWIVGKSPKEHEEMMTYETVQRLDRESKDRDEAFQNWQKQYAKDQTALTKQIAALGQTHHNENIDVAKRENAINIYGILISAVIALVVAAITAYVTVSLSRQ